VLPIGAREQLLCTSRVVGFNQSLTLYLTLTLTLTQVQG
jgi:hypothetical protein